MDESSEKEKDMGRVLSLTAGAPDMPDMPDMLDMLDVVPDIAPDMLDVVPDIVPDIAPAMPECTSSKSAALDPPGPVEVNSFRNFMGEPTPPLRPLQLDDWVLGRVSSSVIKYLDTEARWASVSGWSSLRGGAPVEVRRTGVVGCSEDMVWVGPR
jgi:hypothetical protein